MPKHEHKEIGSNVGNFVVQQLREQYPWMKIEAVHKLAEQCCKTLTAGIDKQ